MKQGAEPDRLDLRPGRSSRRAIDTLNSASRRQCISVYPSRASTALAIASTEASSVARKSSIRRSERTVRASCEATVATVRSSISESARTLRDSTTSTPTATRPASKGT